MFKFFVFFFMILVTNMAYSSIDLFDQNRGKEKVKVQNKVKKPAPPKRQKKKKGLLLTFVGMSKIKTTTLYFKDIKNKQLRVKFQPDKEIALPDYPGLIIKKIENRKLYVSDKKNIYCQDDEKKGISCNKETKTIEMTLVRKYIASPPRAKKSLSQRPKKNNRKVNSRDKSNPRGGSNPFGKPKVR